MIRFILDWPGHLGRSTAYQCLSVEFMPMPSFQSFTLATSTVMSSAIKRDSGQSKLFSLDFIISAQNNPFVPVLIWSVRCFAVNHFILWIFDKPIASKKYIYFNTLIGVSLTFTRKCWNIIVVVFVTAFGTSSSCFSWSFPPQGDIVDSGI